MNDDPTRLDDCGCCDAALASAAERPTNPPGLPAVGYRVGTQPQFLRRMLAALPLTALDSGARPLGGLTTRRTDDPAIGILDAWATASDVLTFYQERIANEGFLRTATERRSVLELAREIGYELRPGVAASTYLAFTVDDAPTSPGTATVPAGTKVQSLPASGGLPQTFETSDALDARAAWNVLRPRLRTPQPLDSTADRIFAQGSATNIKVGDWLMFLTLDADENSTAVARRVAGVAVEEELTRTRVDLENPNHQERKSFYTYAYAKATTAFTPLNNATVKGVIVGNKWNEDDLSAFISIQEWDPGALERSISTAKLRTPARQPTPAGPPEPGVYRFDASVAPFGNNAPLYASLSAELKLAFPNPWDGTAAQPITTNSKGAPWPAADFFLERTVNGIATGSWVLLEQAEKPSAFRVASVVATSLADFVLSARVTGLNVDGPIGDGPILSDFGMRATTAHVRSELVNLAQLPIEDDLGAGTAESKQLTLDTMVLGLRKDQWIMITGERADLAGVVVSESALLTDVVHSGGQTTLSFDAELRNTYVRKTVTINANVVRATHGETVNEILGSGDRGRTNQTFKLKKPPLTYVSAKVPSGTRSTLEVRVNRIRWDESPSLYGLDDRDENYIVRIEDDGTTAVTFGDGERGSRPASGIENVRAKYRSGIGLDGQVPAGSLTLLQTRPAGVKGVTNPVQAAGAADPEALEDARTNAPLQVLAMGRIVSLRDYEDFARGFAGIGKAQAVVLPRGETSLVHITIAAADGTTNVPAAQRDSLQDAIAASSDPGMAFVVETFRRVFFNLSASVIVGPRYQREDVASAVRAAVRTAFSFARRTFGQPVTAAEVVTVIQDVPGVEAVDLDALFRVDDAENPPPATLATVIPAARGRIEAGRTKAGELLVVNPFGIALPEPSHP